MYKLAKVIIGNRIDIPKRSQLETQFYSSTKANMSPLNPEYYNVGIDKMVVDLPKIGGTVNFLEGDIEGMKYSLSNHKKVILSKLDKSGSLLERTKRVTGNRHGALLKQYLSYAKYSQQILLLVSYPT